MTALFELEWLGGPAEHHYRRARPEERDIPWGTLDLRKYPPKLLDLARSRWTEVAINEYRAVAAFSEVVRALAEAMAPLDLVGMASDFLADEVLHTELASRLAMDLGGAAPKRVDMNRFATRANRALSPFERANELVVRVACVSEAFAGGYGLANYRASTHPLPRAVYEVILADEARHQRLGSLYLEWACERMEDAERQRLGDVAADALQAFRTFWQKPEASVRGDIPRRGPSPRDLHDLGWLESAKLSPLSKAIAQERVIAPLASCGIALRPEQLDALGLSERAA